MAPSRHRSWSSIAPALAVLAVLAAITAAACANDTAVPRFAGACIPPAKPAGASITLTHVFDGVKLTSPTELVVGPGERFYALEQAGVIRVIDPATTTSTTAAAVALDLHARIISGGEAGLLGIAFDPAFAQNGFVYLDFTVPLAAPKPGVVFQSVIARFHSNDGGATIDPASEKRLLVVDQPFANHNGGHLAFGPDRLLYISFGDGGSGGDPFGNGQNTNVLLGKLLRVDPSGGDPYGIPPGNPFANGAGRPEIFAYGLRNTWKFSFDRQTGDLWAGDVGQNKFEEVDRIVAGGNYGWSTREGFHCYDAASCATAGFVDPIVEYDHSEGSSITGGFVYRGTRIPALSGRFVYGDFGSGRIWAVQQTGRATYTPELLAETNALVSTFAQSADGELYVADYGTGSILRIDPAAPVSSPTDFGVSLAQTGCLNPGKPTTPPPGLLGYTVNSPLWSDGASKDRWLYVPEDAKIGVGADGDFDVPPGSTAVKTFSIDGKKIETRLFVRYPDATWAGFSYEWNDAQTDATLLADGKTKTLASGQTWTFPSRAQCFTCHTSVAGVTLGLEARQLDRVDADDATGKNQLDRFAAVLDRPIVPNALAPLRAPGSRDGTDEERARGYLHANCSFCHRQGFGAGAATLDLRAELPLSATRSCNVAPQAGDLGIRGAALVTPGDPSRSILALRMRALDQARMPPLASHVVDDAGAAAVDQWIRGLPPTCP